MAQAGYTPIQIYNSATASAAPTAGNLATGELALNITDGKLFYKDNGGVVQVLATKGAGTIGGSNTQVQYNSSGALAGSANMTFNGTTLSVNGLTVSGTSTLSALTASTALALNASKEVVSVTNTGSGNNVLATSPTLVTPVLGAATATSLNGLTVSSTTGTLTLDNGSTLATSGANALTLTTTGATNVTLPTSGTLATTAGTVASFSAGSTGFTPSTATTGAVTLAGTLATTNGGTGLTSFTSGGVVYASSTSALATGSALTYNGTNLGLDASGGAGPAYLEVSQRSRFGYDGTNVLISDAGTGKDIVFTRITEQMRLTSTGLGIGTSSPSAIASGYATIHAASTNGGGVKFGTTSSLNIGYAAGSAAGVEIGTQGALPLTLFTNNVTRATLDSSGNLGLGVTPSAWSGYGGVLELKGQGFVGSATANMQVGANFFFNGSNSIYKTSAAASFYQQNSGTHIWYIAPSGTAGNAITGANAFVQVMTVSSDGTFRVKGAGTAGSTDAFQVSGSAPADAARITSGGNLLVGTTTDPGGGNNRLAVDHTGSDYGLTLNTATSAGLNVLQFRNSNSNGEARLLNNTGGPLTFYRNPTTEAARIDSSGRLLAGLTSNLSGARLQVQGATDTAFTALTINAATNDAYMGIGYNSAGSVWQIFPTYNATAGYKPLAFVLSGSEAARFTTSATFQCVNSISVGNATPTTSGAGITFPATQSASSDANTLDDYEEGTWTPGLSFGGGTTGITYNGGFTGGTYTKVGRMVTVFATVTLTNKGSSTGNVKITGLPFTSANSYYQLATAAFAFNVITSTGQIWAGIDFNATTIGILQTTTAGVRSSLTDTNFVNNSDLQFTMSYFV